MSPNVRDETFGSLFLQAIEADPDASLPVVALCISTGRMALFSENKTKVGQHVPEIKWHSLGSMQQVQRLSTRHLQLDLPSGALLDLGRCQEDSMLMSTRQPTNGFLQGCGR